MRHFNKSIAAAAFLASAFATVQADVGVLDKYECHKHQQTNKYHCHGPADLAKLGGFVLGADLRSSFWSLAAKDPLFIGAAVNAEYNHRWLAATASYFLMVHATDISDNEITIQQGITLEGWDLGVKAGPGVGRLGSKYYATAGWTSPTITDNETPGLNGSSLSGYYVGAGLGFNTKTLVVDLAVTYQDATKINEYLEARSNVSGATVINTRASLGWRF